MGELILQILGRARVAARLEAGARPGGVFSRAIRTRGDAIPPGPPLHYVPGVAEGLGEADGTASGLALVSGVAELSGLAFVSGVAELSGLAFVSGVAELSGLALVSGVAELSGLALVSGVAELSGLALVSGVAELSGLGDGTTEGGVAAGVGVAAIGC
jgi:hypothetical protein